MLVVLAKAEILHSLSLDDDLRIKGDDHQHGILGHHLFIWFCFVFVWLFYAPWGQLLIMGVFGITHRVVFPNIDLWKPTSGVLMTILKFSLSDSVRDKLILKLSPSHTCRHLGVSVSGLSAGSELRVQNLPLHLHTSHQSSSCSQGPA